MDLAQCGIGAIRVGAESLFVARPDHRAGGGARRNQEPPAGSRAASAPAPWLQGADWGRIEALETYAAARDRTMLDVAIAGLAAQPAVSSVISGATSGAQVRANAAALDWVPSAADLAELDEITRA